MLDQSRAADQVVVVDDGSTDDSRTILERFDGRIEVFHTPNRGLLSATNTAFERCTGDIVALLDADDLMVHEPLERPAEVDQHIPRSTGCSTPSSHRSRDARAAGHRRHVYQKLE